MSSVETADTRKRSTREVNIVVAVMQRCQNISVLNASILLGWKRIHFTAISAGFAAYTRINLFIVMFVTSAWTKG